MVSKLSEIWSGLFIPDPDPDFLPIPDPGFKKAPDPGSETLRPTIAVVDIPSSYQAISLTFSANERFLKYLVVILLGIL